MKIIIDFLRHYFSKRILPFWAILMIDCLIVATSMIFIIILGEGAVNTITHWKTVAMTQAVYLPCFIIAFYLFHTYTGVVRYSTFIDLQRLALANATGLLLCILACACFELFEVTLLVKYIGLLLMAMLATLLMWMLRIVVKFVYDMGYRFNRAKRVFIYGTKHGGIALAKNIISDESNPYILAGFVTEEKEYIGKRLMGVRVVGNQNNTIEEMKLRGATILMVSPIYSDSFRYNTELIDRLIDEKIHIYMMPQALEWDGKSDLNTMMLKEVDVEDLLPRSKIEVDMEKVGSMLTDKRILITGAAGSIGSEIVRQVSTYKPKQLILIDNAETPMHNVRIYMASNYPEIETHTIVTSICNKSRMEAVFEKFSPEYVFHAAAYKHVPMMEDNPSEAVQNNIYGTRVIADMSVKYQAKKFVMVSTDKAVNPTNVMGCSKRICEIYVQSLDKAIKEGRINGCTRFVTTRFGNVLGSNGSVIPLFREQIKHGGPITVTHPDIIRYFMLIPEACKLVLQAGTMGNGGEIYIFDMGKPVRIVDLANRMIKLSGAKNVEIKFSGLRDGEKLYEELLNDTEITKPTHHPKIKIAAVREYDYEDAKRNEDELHELSFTYDKMAVVKKMKEIVPEFKSKHSVYECLDV
jgi:FlaA1/EpsC-like NDP-sugar epimerase